MHRGFYPFAFSDLFAYYFQGPPLSVRPCIHTQLNHFPSSAGQQGLRLHLLLSAARSHGQAGPSSGLRRPGGPGVQSGPGKHLEGEPDGAQRRPEVSRDTHTKHLNSAVHVFTEGRYGVCFRSLVALSLILAMLLFKPAPIYILDEVDAALDLSHTQNIGQMLRTHFRHSQVRPHTEHLPTTFYKRHSVSDAL